ncbi:bifunctional riboflavin kinase/FAD synthetase [Arcticibacterium luteifluviistationis]|uniref:Riboflavin biosynthesis protein n=1 Tax=Arcticibacterium luteifluviistationis TaxID=1784714 RepID=A0A2Z4G8B4_9BACT|nr:bifunctional riboflavin kinase/FAD synthetase [Arcticibacterium luteifluviistationis]AWV97335.1 riboflavin biosynthesis protein RibF [Arcticibacterium luteifluviistationis]
MKVYRELSEFTPLKNAVVTSGTFDGVHIGHQKIISRLLQAAKETKGESVVITFWPHPRLVVSPDRENLRLLSNLDEKVDLLANLGVDHLLVLPFTREFSELSSEKYVEDILISGIGTETLVIGYDHRFGKNREGGFDYLKKNSERFKIDIVEIPRQEIDSLTISSTKIRKALQNGEVKIANELLGRTYSFQGLVKKGRQLGRTIGFPTANVNVSKKYKLIPALGVYAVKVHLRGDILKGVMNIGSRPTVEGTGITQEVHILDFDDDIYGENLKVETIDYIRPELKFDGVNELIAQIKRDCEAARKILS